MVNPLPNIKNSDWFILKACTGNKVNFAEKLKFVPNDKILGWSKLKVFEDDDLNVAEMTEFVSQMTGQKTLWENKENACYQHFLLSHNVFSVFQSLEMVDFFFFVKG